MSESPKSPAKKYLKIAAGGVVLLLIAWVGVAYYVSRVAAGPVFDVVQGIGNLEPFMSPLPRGSAVVFGEDTVALLREAADLRPSESTAKRIRILRGQWLPSASEALRVDSTVVGVMLPIEEAERPVVVRLQSRSPTMGAPTGHLILRPGQQAIELYQ